MNTVVVLSGLDRRTDADDPWPAAVDLAARARTHLVRDTLDVVPAIPLWAEAARAHLLHQDDLAALRALAGAERGAVDDALFSLDDLRAADLPTSRDRIEALIPALQLYGIRTAVAFLRSHPDADLGELEGHLLGRSGFAAAVGRPGSLGITGALDHFGRHADLLKAAGALSDLRSIAWSLPVTGPGGPAVARARAHVEDGSLTSGALGGLGLLRAIDAASRGEVDLNDAEFAALRRLLSERTTATRLGLPVDACLADVKSAVTQQATAWRVRSITSPRATVRARAGDVLAVLETLSAGLAPLPRIDLSPTELERVRAVQGLPPDLTQLLLGWQHTVELAEQLGLPASTDRARVLMVAGQLAGRFRALAVSAPSLRARRALQSVTDALEGIAGRGGIDRGTPTVRKAPDHVTAD